MKLGITGASGQLGTFLVRHALARTAPSNLVAITRNPAKLEEWAKQGVETRAGDFAQAAGLADAFRGIDRLVIIPTTDLTPGVRIGQHAAAIDAAVQAGVKHVIYISAVSPRPDPDNVLLESHYQTEQKLMGSGLKWTLLRMGVYMESLGDAAKRARDGKITLADLEGGVFTITNGGIFGSMLSTPIINPPQSAILGVHATKDRPVVENGQIVIRPMNYLALSYDHRIIDGREAVLFLVRIKECLEDPERLLLGV